MSNIENQNTIFTKGERAPADYFTGTVWIKLLVPNDTDLNCQIGNVVFEPGARNNWHTHPGARYLLLQMVLVITRKKESRYNYFVKVR